MFFWKQDRETPLTRAVIDDDIDLVKQLMRQGSDLAAANSLGFKPLDLAFYLGREEIVRFFGLKGKKLFQVFKKGGAQAVSLDEKEYKSFFCSTYTSALRVASYRDFCTLVKRCRLNAKTSRAGALMGKLFENNRKKIKAGYVCESSIRWVGERAGYGLFAERLIKKNAYVGEYIGQFRRYAKISRPVGDYCMRYPNLSFGLYDYVIDSEKMGNAMRFVNHSYVPNLLPQAALENGLSHCIFIALRDIQPGEQLTYDYGEDYWKHRHPPVDF